MKCGFNNDKYVELQAKKIKERISEFGGKLYLEFGGKLFDDYHASRVLPGFAPDAKLRMLQSLASDVEIIIVLNAEDIETGKRRADLGIGYDEDALRLMDAFRSLGLLVGGICITRYAAQPKTLAFEAKLARLNIPVWHHFAIEGYPTQLEHIVSDEGFGKNDYIQTQRPLVVVTAPGPGSGKLATCLSQLYQEHRRGNPAGYAKFETFPVWNLPLQHPVNIAYEAATADLDDRNIIDSFHLEAYGEVTVNYNRDVEAFPVLNAIMEKIAGKSPYQSPTDMGVNMVGLCICDDELCQKAARAEIVRRYFHAAEDLHATGVGKETLAKLELLMGQAKITPDFSPARGVALERAQKTGRAAAALELDNGHVVSAKTSELMGPAAALLIVALKELAGVDSDQGVIAAEALAPICDLKVGHLHSKNPRLHSDEILIALSISSATSPLAQRCIEQLDKLKGCDAYFSAIISSADKRTYRKLGINVCCEPNYEQRSYYHA